MTHFYDRVVKGLDEELKVSMPSRADDSFLHKNGVKRMLEALIGVNALSG